MLINVKMPTIVGILTFISLIDTTFEGLKASSFFDFQNFSFYELLKFLCSVELSTVKSFITSGPVSCLFEKT